MSSTFSNRSICRRTLLRGTGAALALPLLNAMHPAIADSSSMVPPKRFAWVYVPNGVVQEAFHPTSAGRDWQMTPTLAPLARFREQLNVFTGLDREFRGGTGVHAQAGCCWLTSSPHTEALDGGFPVNTSLDQMIAGHIGQDTLLPSLELSCNDHTNQKETKYFETISWYGPGYAANVQKNPRDVFDRLFGKPDPRFHSVLDAVLEDARRLERSLGASDRSKLGEYFDSVRDVEKQIQKAESHSKSNPNPPAARPEGKPDDRGQYIRLMTELITLAFKQDLTRVATLVIDPERWDTPRMYHGLFDSPQNHHVLTHTKGDEARESLKQIDRFHVSQFAHFLRQLNDVEEGNGSLLDNCLITYGSGMGNGRVHDYNDLPIVTAGGLSGAISTGHHHIFKRVPVANLWLKIAQASGLKIDSFADSTAAVAI
ncbi:MAG TPA: hypothetical protein DDW52_28380 [Planctomycetaceae bacterium]|nr:hypothetical protein [Planctomycetaceae bacterium]